jgi:cytochrome c
VISDSAGRAKRARRAAGAILLVIGGYAMDVSPSPAADAAYGEYLAAECATCHRPDGANAAIPPLQGLPYDELVTALEEYREGARANTAMQTVARSLGDAEIEALAAYFSGRP